MFRKAFSAGCFLLAALPACGDSPTDPGGGDKTVVTSVSISPSQATLMPGETKQFSALVQGQGNFSKEVRWWARLGSITTSGVYTAPLNLTESATDTVKAFSVADDTKLGMATVRVVIPPPPPPPPPDYPSSQ